VTTNDQIRDAIQLHQSGKIAEAETIYRRILDTEPQNPAALHMLGVAIGQRGDRQQATQFIARAIAAQPTVPEFHINLALLYLELGDGPKAADAARGALAIRPNDHRALAHLGNALKMMDRAQESIEPFERAIAVKPDFLPAMRHLADSLRRLGRDAEADKWLDRALEIRADDAESLATKGEELGRRNRLPEAADIFRRLIAAHPNHWAGYNGLATSMLYQGRVDEAVPLFEKAIALAPNQAGPRNNLGHAYTLQRRADLAIASLQESLRLDPSSADAHNNLGYALVIAGRTDEAIESLQRSLKLAPDACEAWSNLGNVFAARLQTAPAMEAYNRALYFRPDHSETHWNKAMLALLIGDYPTGWLEHEWRWKKFADQRRDFRRPLWDGGDIAGKTILLHAEQGHGDTIQFARYCDAVARRGAAVILECQRPLFALLKNLQGAALVIARGDPLPPFDFHCPLLSVPYALGIDSPNTIPEQGAYLSPSEESREKWRQLLPPEDGPLKVGLAWAGAPKHGRDYDRTMDADLLSPLADVPGVRFISLQKSEVPRRKPAGLNLLDLTAHLTDFAETAALISHLDLVITVDTAVAHLAAAMGKPVWTMLSFYPDWRWLLGRDDTAWYPTMKLFRQSQAGDWPGVVTRIVAKLRERTNATGDHEA
jgi:tetratricopeptide (TPR) repeat protein